MSLSTSRENLKKYALRRLGAPVINIEIADEQVDDIIDDVIQLYRERVYDGAEEVFLKYQITQTDIDNAKTLVPEAVGSPFMHNNNFIILPESITSVTEVLSLNKTYVGDMWGRSAEFFARENLLYNGNAVGFDIVSYQLFQEYLGAIKYLFTSETRCRFAYSSGRLFIDNNIQNMLGCFIVIRCTRWVDPDEFTRVWNSRFIKDLTTIKMKKQWGQNLSKFSGVSLPGGIKFNSDQIINQAEKELEAFMNSMASDWEIFPTMLIG